MWGITAAGKAVQLFIVLRLAISAWRSAIDGTFLKNNKRNGLLLTKRKYFIVKVLTGNIYDGDRHLH